ncbi:hypothetical protein [Xylophilus sp. GOD-11R]|uniref:hypothetical protein n=1 Tax=Xylophilus sp. GOD-11R TaxID=3089814 RepID=UPI00298C395B|nr:hypothetical protein [Xylophilus sp. GOD-11R]WPB56679.1 hypothetical protein R9X41_21465 [Xylophilus sp. GOD-11R]
MSEGNKAFSSNEIADTANGVDDKWKKAPACGRKSLSDPAWCISLAVRKHLYVFWLISRRADL